LLVHDAVVLLGEHGLLVVCLAYLHVVAVHIATLLRLLVLLIGAAAVAFVSRHPHALRVIINVPNSRRITRAHLVAKHGELLLVPRVVRLQVFVTAAACLREIRLLPLRALPLAWAVVAATLSVLVVALTSRIVLPYALTAT